MIEDEKPLAGIGHNNPPSQIDAAIAEQRQSVEKYRERRDQFVAAAQAAIIKDRESAGDAADIKKLASAVWNEIDAARHARSDPFREAQATLKSIIDEFWGPVWDALDDLQEKVRAWDQAERARIEKQRLEQEQEMRRLMPAPADAVPQCNPAPTAPAREPQRRRIRGNYGGTVIDRTVFDYEVTDVRAVPDFILNATPVHDAIISVAKSMARVTDIPGIKATPRSYVDLR